MFLVPTKAKKPKPKQNKKIPELFQRLQDINVLLYLIHQSYTTGPPLAGRAPMGSRLGIRIRLANPQYGTH